MIIAETPRLILRTFDAEDNDAMCRVLCDPEVMRYSDGIKTPEDIKGWIEECIENYSRHGFGLWAVVLKDSGKVIGYCGLTRFPDIDGQPEIEIGFRLSHSSWSRGYATEAAAAVRDHAFDTLGLSRLVALVDPDNTASIRVAEKIGMTFEKDVMMEDYDHPDRLYVVKRKK